MKTLTLGIVALASNIALGGCVQTVPVKTQAKPPTLNTQFRTSDGDYLRVTSRRGAAQPGKVTICLRNKTKSGWWKGMHWKEVKAKKARYVADGRNARSCGTHPARGMHTWHFYKAKALGFKKRVGSYRINQAAYPDQTIYIDWISD